MKYFLKLIDHLKSIDSVDSLDSYRDLIKSNIAECQPFVVLEEKPFDVLDDKYEDYELDLNMPFKSFFIEWFNQSKIMFHTVYKENNNDFYNVFNEERLENQIYSKNKFENVTTRAKPIVTRGVLFLEVEPLNIQAFLFGQDYDPMTSSNFGRANYCLIPVSGPTSNALLSVFMHTLNKSAVGIEHVRKSVKLSSGKAKLKHRIHHVIHLVPKKDKEKYESSGNSLSWSHRFLVRGHWRKISSMALGKDRAGLYQVRGMTWVSEYQKGSQDAPLVTNVRLVG